MTPQSNHFIHITFEDRKAMGDFIREAKRNPLITEMSNAEKPDTLRVSFRDEESMKQFESVTRLKYPHRVQKKKQTRKAKDQKLDSRGLGVKRMSGLGKRTINAGKGKHNCASKVEHAEWGSGVCIKEMHAAPDADGNIAWYDVMFEHGLERGVSTDDLKILVSEMHENHDHHEGEEEVNESRDRFDYLDVKAASQDRQIAAKKFMDALKKAKIKAQYSRPSGTVFVLRNDLSKAQSIGKRLNILRDGITIRASMSVKEDVNERRFDPSKNPTAKTDKEFDDCKNALVKAGIPHMGLRAIGSMGRERNKFRVHPKFEKKARQILKRFKGCDLEINDKMPEQPMVRKMKKEDVQLDEKMGDVKKSDGPFTVVATKNNKVVGQIHSIEHKELADAIQFMKTDKKGAKISIESKKGKVVHTESVDLDEMSAKAHYNKMVAQGKVGRGGRVVTPIDRKRFPNREREGLEGPFRNRKTSLVYYYDKKAGKYYDPQSDMYLDVKDVMDSVQVEEGLRQAMSGPRETPAQKRKRQEKDNYDLYKKRQKRMAALRGDKSSRKLSPGQEKHYRQTVNLSQLKALSGMKKKNESKDDFTPHMMYDPKTGKGYKADTYADHVRMDKMGYTHEKPAIKEDKVMERELELFISNDANIYRQRITPIIKNMQRKTKAGKYDAEMAIKGFMYAVNDGIKAYNKEFGSGSMKLDKSSKMAVARELRDRFADEFKS